MDRIDADLLGVKERLIRLEVKIEDAQEMREHAREQMSSLNSRMMWLMGIFITFMIVSAPSVIWLSYQQAQLIEDVKKNQELIAQRLEKKTDQLEKKVDRAIEDQTEIPTESRER